MSREQDARRARSRGPTQWGCDREAGCSTPCAWRSSWSPSLSDPAGAGPSGYAPASTREAGMRPAANAAGRRQYGVLVLAGITEASGMSRNDLPQTAAEARSDFARHLAAAGKSRITRR